MERLAIIGTGIAGMACAHYLHKRYDITLFDKNDHCGGHTNTVVAEEEGAEIPIDTGFMVYNQVTYLLLTALFSELDVPTMKTSMSFSVQHIPSGLEYSGSGLNGLFAQRKNIFSGRHIRMLKQIARFNKESIETLSDLQYATCTVKEYVEKKKFGEDMLWKYLIPMSSAVWSTPMDKMLDFPINTLVRFFHNHGFLGLNTQHQWYTVKGGSREYRDRIITPFKEKIRLSTPVVSVKREGYRVLIITGDGKKEVFDKAIIAAHGDEALAMTIDPTAREREVLSCFKYQENVATLHTDGSVMPKTKRAWSSWNYRIEEIEGKLHPSTIYWMNSLQNVSKKLDYFVSINDPEKIDKKKIIKTIRYTHPLFDLEAVTAQKYLHELNRTGPVYFCGSYFKYGFHEDALMSAVDLCRSL